MDLVRDLLSQISDGDLREDEWELVELYHLRILQEAGFVSGINIIEATGQTFVYQSINPQLTWEGHEFFDTIRPKSVWTKIKGVAKEKGVGLTVESITKIGTGVVSALLTAATP